MGERTLRDSILSATEHLGQGTNVTIEVDTCLKGTSDKVTAWTEEEVKVWARAYDGLVMSPVDRNAGDTALICPILHRHGFGKTFTWNADYARVRSTEEDILAACKNDFSKAGLLQAGGWKPHGRLGKAYVIPKDKDLQLWRPITPACSDPAAVAQKRCARALYCLVTRLSRNQNFHLASVQGLVDDLEGVCEKWGKSGYTETVGRCYDIKEMFSSIPHTAVSEAVFDLLRLVENEGWKQVRVATRGKLCTLSKTNRTVPGYISVKLKMILALVQYDLEHAYMVCGEEIRKQEVGIPMGKITSPVLATITCAMAELKFLNSLGTDRSLVRGWRMVDDVSIVVGCTKDEASISKANRILDDYESCYDSKLRLVRKDEGAGYCPFIGGILYTTTEPMQLHFVQETKNTKGLRQGKGLMYQTMQDFDSFSDKRAKVVALSSTLKRLWAATTSKALSIGVIAFAMIESLLRGYPPEFSLRALAILAKVVGYIPKFSRQATGCDELRTLDQTRVFLDRDTSGNRQRKT
ncbi:hypothetical protein CBR_g45582 [Chara braunii]|uniref:Reverse transcriptase domain-containing protein n=1 Tax=Chara braunii TaxID=69332 RepID=A0A388LYX3_CHABU|nr:hypothetical protein CBR_g45582 [Chara braunii]|eukprot:GBG87524.1 hypothetical protein CBR_g45582 [Chara braunii]